MPYAKRRRYPKRKANRVYRRRARRARVNRAFSKPSSSTIGHNFGYPLGNSKLVRHKYSELISLNSGAVTNAYHTFRLNSLYDPNSTGAGHQAYGFDEMCTFFKHYTVVGCRTTVTFINSAAQDVLVALVHDSDTTIDYSTTIGNVPGNHIIEAKKGPYGFLNSTKDQTTLSLNWSLRKNEKVRFPGQAIDWAGDVSSDPVQQACVHVIVTPMDAATDLSVVNCRIQMDFIALWTDPITLNQS